jgi:patatin-like phospholipase/acyl hydrolase
MQVHEMFDLIVGTSTGGFLATLLGLKNLTIDEVREKYDKIRATFGGQNAIWRYVKIERPFLPSL